MSEEILKLFIVINSTEYYERYLVEWAEQKLIENIESNSLIQLAGLVESEYHNSKELFEKAVVELGYEIPSEKEILINSAIQIAHDIVENKFDANKGCEIINNISIQLEYPEELSSFQLLAHEQYGHENIGIYAKDLIPDIKNASVELINKFKTV